MLRELSTNEKLDAVLRYLNDEYTKSFIKPITVGTTTTFAISHNKVGYFKNKQQISIGVSFGESAEHIDELSLILEYLEEVEHYIARLGKDKDPYTVYRIIYEGKVFIENGGYAGRAKAEKWRNCNQNIQTLTLTVGTILAGIGGVGILVIEIYKLLHK